MSSVYIYSYSVMRTFDEESGRLEKVFEDVEDDPDSVVHSDRRI
jgi:hypothetical protein